MKQPDELLMKQDGENLKVEIQTSLMRRPFPLIWGLASLALFGAFALITQWRFNQLNEDRIYETDLRAWELSIDAHNDCVESIEIRNTYREIFGGIEVMFERTGALPNTLFPESLSAQRYRDEMIKNVKEFITDPVEHGLPPRSMADCPVIQPKPERP